MDQAVCNPNGKIQVFWGQDVNCKVLEDDEQQITCEFQHSQFPHNYIVTFIYAKCSDQLRKPLWDMLLELVNTYNDFSQCVVGDFNVINATEENKSGVPYNMKKEY